LVRKLDQFVGDSGHGRNDCNHSATAPLRFDESLRHTADSLGSTDRSAAVFLNNQAHVEGGPLLNTTIKTDSFSLN
jgi:hypothetical protein